MHHSFNQKYKFNISENSMRLCRIISLMLFSFHPDVVQPAALSPHYRVIHFDVSGVDLTNSTLVKAEFRIFRAPNPQARASEQRVEIYQVNSCMTTRDHFYKHQILMQ